MPALLGGLWGKALPYLIGAAVIALALLALVSKLIGAGRAAERADGLARSLDLKRRMDDAHAAGPRTRDDVDRKLRDGTF